MSLLYGGWWRNGGYICYIPWHASPRASESIYFRGANGAWNPLGASMKVSLGVDCVEKRREFEEDEV